jgi:hypothetical protein
VLKEDFRKVYPQYNKSGYEGQEAVQMNIDFKNFTIEYQKNPKAYE